VSRLGSNFSNAKATSGVRARPRKQHHPVSAHQQTDRNIPRQSSLPPSMRIRLQPQKL
jgi:hypothetical protein